MIHRLLNLFTNPYDEQPFVFLIFVTVAVIVNVNVFALFLPLFSWDIGNLILFTEKKRKTSTEKHPKACMKGSER